MAVFGNYVEKALFAILKGNADLVAVVPSSRMYADHLPQNPTYPAITYQLVSEELPHNHDRSAGPTRARFQISCWSQTKPQAAQVRELVKGVLVAYKGTAASINVQGIFYLGTTSLWDPDEEIELWQEASDYYVFITP